MSNTIPKWLLAYLAPFMLTGCLLSPGKFTSELELLENDRFSFSYDGEIQMLALTDLAQMEAMKGSQPPEPSCYDEETFEDRECSEEEKAEQKAEWEEIQAAQTERRAREAEQMKAVLGGIDPSDPEAAADFAEKLQRQRHWDKVEYKGNGLFDVEFNVSGTLTTDFMFPVIEKLHLPGPFVTVILRDDDQVRVEAPGLAGTPHDGSDPMTAMLGGGMGMSALMMAQASEKGQDLDLSETEGTFRIVTNGRILANNTDEGPTTEGRREVLTWEISPRNKVAPTALIGF